MSQENSTGLKWWQKLLFRCFDSYSSVLLMAYTILFVPSLVCFIAFELGAKEFVCKVIGTIVCAIWSTIVLMAGTYYHRNSGKW